LIMREGNNLDRRTNRYSLGWIIALVGLAILLGELGFFSALGSFFWPLLLLVPGIILHLLHFNRSLPSSVLIPGGILVIYSLMFFYCNIFGWGSMSYLWSAFIFGVAVGLYEYYLFDRYPPRGVFIAAVALGALSLVLFVISTIAFLGMYLVAALLIVIGIMFFYRRRPRAW
jgi:hypothetical protein